MKVLLTVELNSTRHYKNADFYWNMKINKFSQLPRGKKCQVEKQNTINTSLTQTKCQSLTKLTMATLTSVLGVMVHAYFAAENRVACADY